MKNKRYLDLRHRHYYKDYELKLKIFKILKLLLNTKIQMVNIITIKKYLINFKSYKTKLNNRCIITGRSHAIQHTYKISRIMLKKLIDNNKFSGYYKDSW